MRSERAFAVSAWTHDSKPLGLEMVAKRCFDVAQPIQRCSHEEVVSLTRARGYLAGVVQRSSKHFALSLPVAAQGHCEGFRPEFRRIARSVQCASQHESLTWLNNPRWRNENDEFVCCCDVERSSVPGFFLVSAGGQCQQCSSNRKRRGACEDIVTLCILLCHTLGLHSFLYVL